MDGGQLTNDYVGDHISDYNLENIKIHQRLFHIECLSDIERTLTDSVLSPYSQVTRCEKCGFPLHIRPVKSKEETEGITQSSTISESQGNKVCTICSRTKILNAVLITTYFLSAALFLLLIVGVIFTDEVELDITLMIGCLEIIGLLFFGRFLEEAVFFGFSQEQKLLAALYRFSESGEIQALDIAMKYIKKYKKEAISFEFFRGILNIMVFQPTSVPYNFQSDLMRNLMLSEEELEKNLSSIIDEEEETLYLIQMIQKVPPAGLSYFIKISLATDNQLALQEIFNRLEKDISLDPVDSELIKEFFINQIVYEKAFTQTGNQETLEKIKLLIENFKAPRVPAIDVVEGSRKIMQNPLVKYALRIFLYIALAFLIGWLYQLLN